ncbi:MAG: mannose-1-phosphate guanylyltransferase/mannose-6-phosphate isomerase [Alphaproteobacteria bacterium]|nr:mannose-1-phosphate guanylyltransferase/mannose-6-phosphate isomerase [Alphaproteobacteria bacterium]
MTFQPIVPIILGGGAGTRLWPLSRADFPKQFYAIQSENTLLQETACRFRNNDAFAAPWVACNAEHRFIVVNQLQAVGVQPTCLLLEPFGRNTAAAVAYSSLALERVNPGAIALFMPADHIIHDLETLLEAVLSSVRLAIEGGIVTFGVRPEDPNSNFGYIVTGEQLGAHAHRIARFHEKPDIDDAKGYIDEGNAFWNAGLILCRVDRMIDEFAQFAPTILAACERSLGGGRRLGDAIFLDDAAFEMCPAQPIDRAIMEKTKRGVVVPIDMGWSDVGSWRTVKEATASDANGNVVVGDAYLTNTQGCYVRADERLVVTVGVQDLYVVDTSDALLIASRTGIEDLGAVVEALGRKNRPELDMHRRVHRPWGFFETLQEFDGYKVKSLTILPNKSISLQKHNRRSEHWVVVSGVVTVTLDSKTIVVYKNQSIFVPVGAVHRLENTSTDPTVVIEVQTGEYLGEDDIVRLEDQFGRL